LLDIAITCGEIADLGVVRGHRTFLVTGPRLIEHIFEHNAANYSKKTVPSLWSSRLLLGDGLLASENDTNRSRRKLMAGAFHGGSLASLYGPMAAVLSERIAEWRSRGQAFEIDMADEMRDLSQRIVIRTLLSGEHDAATRRACDALKIISEYVGRTFLAERPLPLIVPTRDNLRYRRALSELNAAIVAMIESHRRDRTGGTLLAILMLALERGDVSEAAVRDEIVNMFLAGQESVSASLTWIWYLLARTPSARRIVEAELTGLSSGEMPSLDEVNAAAALQRVVDESMRLYPPGWLIDRLALHDDTVGVYRIPAGSMVLVSQFVSHRLPEHWEDPEGFDPDRFCGDRRISPFVYFPWGIGRYLCYGKAFALLELKLVVATLARHFRLSLRAGDDAIHSVPGIALRPERLRMTIALRSRRDEPDRRLDISSTGR
jgi:cytochrome P450